MELKEINQEGVTVMVEDGVASAAMGEATVVGATTTTTTNAIREPEKATLEENVQDRDFFGHPSDDEQEV